MNLALCGRDANSSLFSDFLASFLDHFDAASVAATAALGFVAAVALGACGESAPEDKERTTTGAGAISLLEIDIQGDHAGQQLHLVDLIFEVLQIVDQQLCHFCQICGCGYIRHAVKWNNQIGFNKS